MGVWPSCHPEALKPSETGLLERQILGRIGPGDDMARGLGDSNGVAVFGES